MDKGPSPAEQAKIASSFLRGTIAEELQNDSTLFSKPATSVLKFHGIYQQDDRDLRKLGQKEFSAMVRVGVPGGVLTGSQYLGLDELADIGDGSLRITTRQDIQYHYVPKLRIRELIQGLHRNYLGTFAACGDVVRNTVSCPAPFQSPERKNLQPFVELLAKALKPKTTAYYDIWVGGERVATAEESEPEPLYGATYLPRKFKIGFAFPGDNTTDVYANDVGIVPQYEDGKLSGFVILAGGGMGQSAGVKASHPRLADPICLIGPSPEELLEVTSAIVTIHRDFGNRTNRKLARLKYVLDDWGVPKFKAELEQRVGRHLADPLPLTWTRANDYLGWHPQNLGSNFQGDAFQGQTWFFGLAVVSGRVRDFDNGVKLRAALRKAVSQYNLSVRLTSQQNVYLCDVQESDRAAVAQLLRDHGVAEPDQLPPVLRHAIACPALPTCGQAITESERMMPDLVAELQSALNELGLSQDVVHLRTSGCPNGCSRPYTAEIGIVGASVDMYTIYLGASPLGTRIGTVFAQNVKRGDIIPRLRPVLEHYRTARQAGEHFGDFCHRIGLEALREATVFVAA